MFKNCLLFLFLFVGLIFEKFRPTELIIIESHTSNMCDHQMTHPHFRTIHNNNPYLFIFFFVSVHSCVIYSKLPFANLFDLEYFYIESVTLKYCVHLRWYTASKNESKCLAIRHVENESIWKLIGLKYIHNASYR